MFASKRKVSFRQDVLPLLSQALAGYAAGMGNPVGIAAVQGFWDERRRKAEAEFQSQQYQQHRQDALDDWIAKQNYALAHPELDELGKMMLKGGIDPNSPQGKAFYAQAVQNKVNPFTQMRVQNPDGSESLSFVRPPMGGAGLPPIGTVMDDPRRAGGPTPQASGPFPAR